MEGDDNRHPKHPHTRSKTVIRTTILALATFTLTAAMGRTAEQPKPGDKEGFHVYRITPRRITQKLLGVYASPQEAFEFAAKHRAAGGGGIEVTTGSEGKEALPALPVLYHVYSRPCSRSAWQRQGIYGDYKKVEEVIKKLEKEGEKVEIVRDYAPKAVFHIYSRACRTLAGKELRLIGTYVTAGEACEAAADFRTAKYLRSEVTTGSKGPEYLVGTPTRYEVYVGACKAGWSVAVDTDDWKKAYEAVEARKKEDKAARVEIVRHYGPKASGVFDGKKVRFSGAEGVEPTLALLESCSTQREEGTAADFEAALKGDHFRLVFAEPREVEVGNGKVRVSEIVLTLPLSTGVFWLRSENKVLRASKFRPEKVAPFRAWLGKARSAE
jgi:hypothetical protein